MIVTTGLALIYESLANYIAGGVEQTLPSNLRAFGQMPGDIILAVLVCGCLHLLNYTKIGTYTYAIGSNEFVAKNMGIDVDKYKGSGIHPERRVLGSHGGLNHQLRFLHGGSNRNGVHEP